MSIADEDDYGWGDHLLHDATPQVESGIAPEGLASKVVLVRSNHIERIEHDIPHHNCDGIPVLSGKAFLKANAMDAMASSNSDLQNPHPSDEVSSICVGKVEHGDRSPKRTSTVKVTPRPSTREERIRAILIETFECQSDHAGLIAVEFLSGCLRRGLDPIESIVDLSLRWKIVRLDSNPPSIDRLGAWLDNNVKFRRQTVDVHKQSYAAIREKIVTAVRTKSAVKAADLRDYWDHCIATGKSHDAIFLQAIAELEEAGLVSRHGHSLSIHAEELKIEPKRREEVTKAEGMEMVQLAAINAWGSDVWEQRLDDLLRNLPWWRNMGGLALRGLADWVQTL